jgi:hypothetical protein
MTDGGSRVHPDDEGVEILDSENDDDSDIIDAGDDGIIMTDGGSESGRIEVTDGGGLTFSGEVGDLPVAAPAILGRLVESYPTDHLEPGTVIGTFPTGDIEALELREPDEFVSTDGGDVPVSREFKYESNAGTVRVIRKFRLLSDNVLEMVDVEKMYNYQTEEFEEVHSFTHRYEVTDDGLLVGDGSGWDGSGRLWWEYFEERHEKRLRLRFPSDFGEGDDDVSLEDVVETAVRRQIE